MKLINITLITILVSFISCAPKTSYELLKKADRTISWDKKENLYLEALKIDSNSIEANLMLGWHYANNLNIAVLSKSRKYFDKCILLDSTESWHWYSMGYTYLIEERGLSYQHTEKLKEARKNAIFYFTKATSIDSTQDLYFYQRGRCYFDNQMESLAYIDYTKSCELGNSLGCLMSKKED